MIKKAIHLGDQFSKIAKATGLIRLKVFYQLLIVIIVMIIFLGIQAYTSDKIIKTMQKTTQIVFIDSSGKTDQISRLKQTIAELRTVYLEKISNDSSVTNNSLSSITDRLIIFDWLDAENKRDIYGKVAFIKKLVSDTPSMANYQLLRSSLFQLNIKIGLVESNIASATINAITENNRFLSESRTTGVVILTISLVFSIILGLVIVNSISMPLKQVEAAAKSIAIGDLTHQIRADGSPEILRVVAGLNQAISGLRELISNINSQSEALSRASQELKTASSETGRSASEVAMAMQEMTNGSVKQANQISEATRKAQLFSEMVRKVSDDTETIASASQKVVQSAQVGLKATIDVADEIQELYLSTKQMDGVIGELSKSTDEINEIISAIRGIADQISLLALNAAIEAARAGEHGKGFAVVAQETGKLADQSKQAVGMIEDLIAKIKGRTTQAVQAMQQGMARAENGKDLTSRASKTFEEITQALNNNLTQIEVVAQSTRKMSDDNNTIIEKIAEIASISEESLASTEEVSATAEEQSASSEEVAAFADSLSQIADSLNRAVAAFELEEKQNEI
ncbi:MAG TPA: hypothetical protein DDW50_03985 [Firmicutes bacterium]|jgi:methyl-accepting chemotaxis protein|nr:hypothetical protein [Bacillota bacterium]